MDAVDKAQIVLEGRCLECKERLPEHSKDCSQHPWKTVMQILRNLKNKLTVSAEED